MELFLLRHLGASSFSTGRFRNMKKTEPQVTATDEAAEQVLWDCLAEIPFVKVQKVEQRIITDPGRPEIVARINTAKGDRLILAVLMRATISGRPGSVMMRCSTF